MDHREILDRLAGLMFVGKSVGEMLPLLPLGEHTLFRNAILTGLMELVRISLVFTKILE